MSKGKTQNRSSANTDLYKTLEVGSGPIDEWTSSADRSHSCMLFVVIGKKETFLDN